MKKIFFLSILFIGVSICPDSFVNAQGVGINPSGNPPASSAMLDVNSTDKGLLIPRLTTVQRDAITNPDQSLLIFNTTTNCLEIYISPIWQSIYCGCTPPSAPTAGISTATDIQIVWNWNAVSGATGYKYSTTNNYSTATDNSTSTSYTQTGLTCNTAYSLYVWAYIACGNSTATTLTQITSACFTCGSSTISDFDGNIYNTVNIGTQCWMKQNLKTTKYSNGIAMIDGTGAGDITSNFTSKYYFDYDNNPANTSTYGKLYTWAAIMNGAATSNLIPSGVQGPCPIGWHVPSDAEWSSLESNQGGSSVAGCHLKEAGLSHWLSPNFCADNSSGFTALPGGYRHSNGTFGDFGYLGYWWSSTESSTTNAWYRRVNYSISDVSTGVFSKSGGWSVRCLKD